MFARYFCSGVEASLQSRGCEDGAEGTSSLDRGDPFGRGEAEMSLESRQMSRWLVPAPSSVQTPRGPLDGLCVWGRARNQRCKI